MGKPHDPTPEPSGRSPAPSKTDAESGHFNRRGRPAQHHIPSVRGSKGSDACFGPCRPAADDSLSTPWEVDYEEPVQAEQGAVPTHRAPILLRTHRKRCPAGPRPGN